MDAEGEDTLERDRVPRPEPGLHPDVESTVLTLPAGFGAAAATSAAPPSGAPLSAPPPRATLAPPSGPVLSSFGRVRVGAETVVLATPVVIGRNPGRPRVPAPVVRMTVPSPVMEISASHLEVRQAGGTIVLRDLDSTNGSLVHLPSGPPRLLARGDSIAVPPGTIVDLGEGVEVEILAPAASPVP